MNTGDQPCAADGPGAASSHEAPSRRVPVGRPTGTWYERRSTFLSGSLLVLGALLLLLGALFAWARATIFDSDGFADAATESLRDEAVQDRLTTELTDRIVANDAERVRLRPLILGATAAIIDSSQFVAIFTAAVERLHHAVFHEGRNEVLLDLSAALPQILALIERVAPEVAARIPPDAGAGVVSLAEGDYRARLVRLSNRVEVLAIALPVLSLLAFTASLYVARPRGAAVFRLGIALAVTAAVVLLALLIGGAALRESVRSANGPAADGIWWSFVDSLRTTMRVIALIGVATAAGAWWAEQRRRGQAGVAPATGSTGSHVNPSPPR